jgi:hypothetical protein
MTTGAPATAVGLNRHTDDRKLGRVGHVERAVEMDDAVGANRRYYWIRHCRLAYS